MLKLIKKRLSEKQNQPAVMQKSQYDFVERYVLADPKNVFPDYSLFDECKEIPVAYENAESQTSVFKHCVRLPNKTPFSDLLYKLKISDSKAITNPIYRTIAIVNIAPGKRIFILPDVKRINNPICVVDFGDDDTDNWVFYMTPTINHAVVEQAKMFTRFQPR